MHCFTIKMAVGLMSLLNMRTVAALASNSSDDYVVYTITTSSVYTVVECGTATSFLPASSSPAIYYNTSSSPLDASSAPVSTAPASAAPTLYTTSTIYATSTKTINMCAPTVTNCPYKSVTTVIVAISTTICPVAEAESTATSTPPTPFATYQADNSLPPSSGQPTILSGGNPSSQISASGSSSPSSKVLASYPASTLETAIPTPKTLGGSEVVVPTGQDSAKSMATSTSSVTPTSTTMTSPLQVTVSASSPQSSGVVPTSTIAVAPLQVTGGASPLQQSGVGIVALIAGILVW